MPTKTTPLAAIVLTVFAAGCAGDDHPNAAAASEHRSPATATAPARIAPPATAAAPGRSVGSPTAGARSLRGVRAQLAKEARGGAFAGTVLVTRGGRPLLSAAFGQANARTGDANTRQTLHNVGSIGKTFTAVAIAQLVQQGRLSYDDPVDRFVPGLPSGITIGQLLTHTSGLGDVFMDWHPNSARIDLADALDRIRRQPAQFPAGQGQAYSNSGYVVLGAVIEAITKTDYYRYVSDHVFRPVGMTHTGWFALGSRPHMAHGYLVGPGGRLQDSRNAGGFGNPSGGAWSTADDLTRFARALLSHRLLDAATTDLVLTGRVPKPTGGKVGYGFEDETLGAVRILGHGGGAPGREAQLRFIPASGTVIVVLANRDNAARPAFEAIVQALPTAAS